MASLPFVTHPTFGSFSISSWSRILWPPPLLFKNLRRTTTARRSSHDPALLSELDYYHIVNKAGRQAQFVVARRLAEGEPNARVLLIEAGPGNVDLVDSHMIMGWLNLHSTEHDWDYDSQPLKHANNRVIHLPRGKFLGGTSGLNATLMIRGTKADYDEWESLGNPGWSWNDVLPLFKKANFLCNDIDETLMRSTQLVTTFHPPAPISEAILDSYISKGFTIDQICSFKARAMVWDMQQGRFTRESERAGKHAQTLRLCRASLHFGPLRDSKHPGSPKYQAVAVQAERKIDVKRHAVELITLSREKRNSHLRRGIGPKEHLEEHGIDVKVDLKSVGQNLSDHPTVFQFYRLNSTLTYDHLVYPPDAIDSATKEWLDTKSGIMGRFPLGPFAFVRLDKLMEDKPEWKAAKEKNPDKDPMGQLLGQPHIEYYSTELYAGGRQHPHLPTKADVSDEKLLRNFNDALRTAVPWFRPPQFPRSACETQDRPQLSGKGLDVSVLAEGARYAHEIVIEGAGTREHIAGAWPSSRVYPNGDEEWKEYVRQQVWTSYHPSSTCKMGPDWDEEAVVDPRLRVRGVKGLRVADTSIMPKLNNGHPQAPAYMIGEKAAVLILEDNRVPE
ncbi:GMC oxidoreductase [Hydnum rufescens UP504]|uniref:GMC oxidoreductase n=1 Tax=Hydnum rufescens UP504 TaxID=1448309 RepID=A0A9P6E0T3_9AGAM|nr:GMC oxidoreductase [Hydnum rufescens UP504]